MESINLGFWGKLKKPIMVQAPMSGVTDQSCRLMLAKYGPPDVFWTEFISASALFSSKAQKYCLGVLKFSKRHTRQGGERPIVAQIFGSKPIEIQKTSEFIVNLGFDGIDINMGCPDRNIEKQGAGAVLIKNPNLAREIIRATKKGVNGKIPVSVKTRIGYNENEILKWIPVILKESVAVLTVHFRTKKQGYLPPANWELVKDIINLRNKYAPKTLIIGNGDVKSLEQAKLLAKQTGLDGIMIGRATIGNPWFFKGKEPTIKQKLKAIIEHIEIFPEEKHFDSIKKHLHFYCKGFLGCKDLKNYLMKTKNKTDAKNVVLDFIKNNNI